MSTAIAIGVVALLLISVPVIIAVIISIASARCDEAREEIHYGEEFWRWPPV